jgi:tetratricopeptide (TPR) repeat protein
LGEKQKALEYYSQSLPLRRATGDRGGEAYHPRQHWQCLLRIGRKTESARVLQPVPSPQPGSGRSPWGSFTLNNIGIVYSEFGEKQKALEYYSQSLPLVRAVGNRNGEATILYRIATVKRDQNNLTEAFNDIESSIKIIENLRTKIASPELRSSYFATVQNYYEFYIDLLMQLHKTNPKSGYDTKALEASERSRARSLLELLQESNANIREGISPDLLQQEKSVQQQLDAIEKQRIEAISSPNPNQTKIAEIDKQRLALLEQYQQIKPRFVPPAPAMLPSPNPNL